MCRDWGGASDIRIGGTALENRVIIAGGGGGSAVESDGGVGGNEIGGNGINNSPYMEQPGRGGTQSKGGDAYHGLELYPDYSGRLGFGGDGKSYAYGGPSGGGAYFGGGGGCQEHAGAGGGSSHASSLFKNVQMQRGINWGDGRIIITVISAIKVNKIKSCICFNFHSDTVPLLYILFVS